MYINILCIYIYIYIYIYREREKERERERQREREREIRRPLGFGPSVFGFSPISLYLLSCSIVAL